MQVILKLKHLAENLDDDAISVGKLKSSLNNNVFKCGLAFLKLHLSELTTKLTNLEKLTANHSIV